MYWSIERYLVSGATEVWYWHSTLANIDNVICCTDLAIVEKEGHEGSEYETFIYRRRHFQPDMMVITPKLAIPIELESRSAQSLFRIDVAFASRELFLLQPPAHQQWVRSVAS